MADLHGARLSLVGQTCKAWFSVLEARRQAELAEATVENYRASEKQVRERYERGLRSGTLPVPLVVGFSMASIQSLNPRLLDQIVALGANRLQLLWLIVREARLGLLAALMAGFGAVISEVGASMMVGGNIAGETRVLTTATVLETSRGNIEIGIALGVMPSIRCA